MFVITKQSCGDHYIAKHCQGIVYKENMDA